MLKVSVTSTEVRNQSGTSKASGKPYSLNFQTVWVHTFDKQGTANPYPEKVEIILEKNEQGALVDQPSHSWRKGSEMPRGDPGALCS
jgi:hypothetical protein